MRAWHVATALLSLGVMVGSIRAESGRPGWMGASPGLAGELDGVHFGMTLAELENLSPALAGSSDRRRDGKEPQAGARFFEVVHDDDIVTGVVVYLPGTGALRDLARAWGKPSRVNKWTFWYNKKAGVRALAMASKETAHTRVELAPYLPLSQLIGTRGRAFGFEKQPLLGATVEELRKRYGTALRVGEQTTLSFPASEFSSGQHVAWLTVSDGRVTEFEWTFEYGCHPADRARFLELLHAKLGASHQENRPDGLRLVFAGKPEITVREVAAASGFRVFVK